MTHEPRVRRHFWFKRWAAYCHDCADSRVTAWHDTPAAADIEGRKHAAKLAPLMDALRQFTPPDK